MAQDARESSILIGPLVCSMSRRPPPLLTGVQAHTFVGERDKEWEMKRGREEEPERQRERVEKRLESERMHSLESERMRDNELENSVFEEFVEGGVERRLEAETREQERER